MADVRKSYNKMAKGNKKNYTKQDKGAYQELPSKDPLEKDIRQKKPAKKRGGLTIFLIILGVAILIVLFLAI